MASFCKVFLRNGLDQIKAPMLVIQVKTPKVPVSEAVQIVNALRKAKRSVWYMNALNEAMAIVRKEPIYHCKS